MSNKLCNKLSNKTPSYLTVRNGIYYFCYRIPSSQANHKGLIRYSLRTRDILEARERAVKLVRIVKDNKQNSQRQYLDSLCGRVKSKIVNGDSINMNSDDNHEDNSLDLKLEQLIANTDIVKVEQTIRAILNPYGEEIEEEEIVAAVNSFSANAYQEVLIELNKVVDYLSKFIGVVETDQQYDMVIAQLTEAEKKHKRKNIIKFNELIKSTEYFIYVIYGDLTDSVRSKIKDVIEKVIFSLSYPISAARAFVEGNTAEYNAIKNELKQNEFYTASGIIEKIEAINIANQSHSKKDLPVISHFIPDFLSWDERSRSEDIINGYKRDLEFLIFSIGDKPVNQVTKQDIKESLQIKAEMPRMSLKSYKEQGVGAVICAIKNDIIEIPEEHRVSSKSVRETLKSYQSFFSAYLFKSKDILTKSPTENVTFKYQSIPYANYTDSQMNLIVNYYEQQEVSDKQLVILTACYTGMRLSEICSLTSESVKHDTESGYNYIFIEKGKTDAARRVIPISKKLEATGLIEYLNQLRPNQKLYSKKPELINDELRKARETLAIPHENEYEQRRVFHSLRHSLITKARSKGITDPVLQKVVGHQTNKTITDRYTHVFPVQDLTCVVECLPW